MSDYPRQPPGSSDRDHHHPEHHHHHHHDDDDCCEPISDPADQPREPRCECEPLQTWHPPELKKPETCPPDCRCPVPPTPPGPTCLDDLIRHQDKEISDAEHAKEVRDALQAFDDKAKTAVKDYTDKYRDLIKDWKRIDCDIAELVRRLECNITCWRCLIECHVCPLIEAIRYRRKLLYDEWKTYDEVHSLYDLQYWHGERRAPQAARIRPHPGGAARVGDAGGHHRAGHRGQPPTRRPSAEPELGGLRQVRV